MINLFISMLLCVGVIPALIHILKIAVYVAQVVVTIIIFITEDKLTSFLILLYLLLFSIICCLLDASDIPSAVARDLLSKL